TGKHRAGHGGKAAVAGKAALELDDEGNAAIDEVEQVFQRGDDGIAGTEAGGADFGERMFGNIASGGSQTVERVVVKDDDTVVGGQLDIALDGEAAGDGGFRGRKRVLDP